MFIREDFSQQPGTSPEGAGTGVSEARFRRVQENVRKEVRFFWFSDILNVY